MACGGGKPVNILEQRSYVIRAALKEHGSCRVVLEGVGVEVRVG